MFCPACGQEAAESDSFCQYCGQPLPRTGTLVVQTQDFYEPS